MGLGKADFSSNELSHVKVTNAREGRVCKDTGQHMIWSRNSKTGVQFWEEAQGPTWVQGSEPSGLALFARTQGCCGLCSGRFTRKVGMLPRWSKRLRK